ncbi:MAG: SEC-C domain-containing protein [Nitrospinae bacterium]|nr:SEC-C domain-containing protein [Nitrospinota bacterium]
MKKGRNDPSPCGSGKKYKKCCLMKEVAPSGFENAQRGRLVRQVKSFAERRYRHEMRYAFEEFSDGADPQAAIPPGYEEMFQINFNDWMLYDWTPEEDGRSLMDRFLAESRLSDGEQLVLERMARSFLSLYEIQEVFPGKGMVLRDLLREETHEVSEKAGSRSVKRWDLIAARLIPLDGTWIISGSVYPFLRRDKEYLLKEILDDFEGYLAGGGGPGLDDYLKSEGALFNYLWMEALRPPAMPTLSTTTGEAMVFANTRYRLADAAKSRIKLERSKEFEHDEGNDIYLWFGPGSKKSMPVVLGTVTIRDGYLVLECQSKERLERGKKCLELLLKGEISHPFDSYEDVGAALRRRQEEGQAHRDEVDGAPDENEAALMMAKFKRQHYEKTLKQRIPMLEDKTPRQALRTKRGRALVIEWLKLLENSEAHEKKTPGTGIDLLWMWEQLGLESESEK